MENSDKEKTDPARGVPAELEDALARIEQAKDSYERLAGQLEMFLYEYVKGMVKERDRETGDFVLQLRHPQDSNIRGRPLVLVSQVVENLHFALDYMVFELSGLNVPGFDGRVPQFVIADSEAAFREQAKNRLRYLTKEQIGFLEQLQPYNGGEMLALLKDMAVQGKHRHLLSLQDSASWDIYFADMAKREEYRDCFVYPVEEGQAVFARPKGEPVFLLLDKYDAVRILGVMIQLVWDILRASYCFFQGLPFKLNIIRTQFE